MPLWQATHLTKEFSKAFVVDWQRTHWNHFVFSNEQESLKSVKHKTLESNRLLGQTGVRMFSGIHNHHRRHGDCIEIIKRN